MMHHSRHEAPVARARTRSCWRHGVAALALAFAPLAGYAHTLSMDECVEGGDFIANAALARDAGVAKSVFLEKVRDDLVRIQAFPPRLRWFVQDDEDAEFLLDAASKVFDQPKAPDAHRGQFLLACMERGAEQGEAQEQPREKPWTPGKSMGWET